MGDTIFRIFNPKGHKEDAVEKRRAQLRRAQQSYRERKDKYTKSLEAEVARVRADERRLKSSLEQLRDTVEMLASLLAQHGIPIPTNALGGDALDGTRRLLTKAKASPPAFTIHHARLPGSSENAVALTDGGDWENNKSTKARRRLQQQLPKSPESLEDFASFNMQSNSGIQQDYQDSPVLSLGIQHSKASISSSHDHTQLCELDSSILGMEFVLALEQPCLGHLWGNPDSPDEPNCHALTASAQLPFGKSTSYPQEECPVVSVLPEERENVLDRLLRLAPNVCSDDEVTPIQAWNHIRCRPLFGGLTVKELRVFAGKLRDTVSCHGFGAVIQKDSLETVVLETLILGRPF